MPSHTSVSCRTYAHSALTFARSPPPRPPPRTPPRQPPPTNRLPLAPRLTPPRSAPDVQVIATGELGLELGPDFGVAPSTLSFRAGEVASVPGSGGVDAAKL